MREIVDGNTFLALPDGTRFRSMNLITNEPMGEIEIKTGLRKDALGRDVMGYYSMDEATREETSSCMPCPSACKFQIL